MKLFSLLLLPLFALAAIAQEWSLVRFADPVAYQGQSFTVANVRIQDGSESGRPAGYVFRPVRVIPAVSGVEATETTPIIEAQPERTEELGGEYYAPSSAPSLANAAADIAAHCAIPQPAPAPESWRVLKDTIVLRTKEAGKLTQLRQVIAGLNEDQRFEWDSASWFTSTNPLIVQGVQAIGLDPAVILARDPLAP